MPRAVAWASRPLSPERPAPARKARAEPVLSTAKECPRHSGRDAHATARGMAILAMTAHGQDARGTAG